MDTVSAWAAWESSFTMAIGLFIGGAVGGLGGFLQGGKTHTLRGLGLGMLLGLIGIKLGDGIGSPIFQVMTGGRFDAPIFIMIPARLVALTLSGAGLGLGIGAASLNKKKTLQGLIGGAIGGALAGGSFDIVSNALGSIVLRAQGLTSGEVGGPGRAVFAVLIGAATALFIGLVEQIARSAWLRLELGRNEGREWSIDGPTMVVRSEAAQVPIFGDPQIAPNQCAIQPQNGQYWLTDLASPNGTYLNGQRLIANQPVMLTQGAAIGLGSSRLIFLLKGQPAPPRPVDGRFPAPQPAGPSPLAGYGPSAGIGLGQPMAPVSASAVSMAPTVAMPAASMMPTTAMPSAAFTLAAMDGPLAGQRFSLSGPTEIGREAPAIPLAFDGAVSRRHATLTPSPAGVAVSDLGSSNGTFVDGQRVQQAMLQPGHTLRVGTTTFRLEQS
jgi:pSer/pThr/pTyr-binding forkhead associated (FHA) protein